MYADAFTTRALLAARDAERHGFDATAEAFLQLARFDIYEALSDECIVDRLVTPTDQQDVETFLPSITP